MTLKKTEYADDEIPIFDEAVIYKRGDYWQMRMWLTKERKYYRHSLRTRNRDTAIDKAKKQYHELMAMELAGKTYFSLTTKQGVALYLEQRRKDVDAGRVQCGPGETDMGRGQPGRSEAARRVRGGRIDGSRCPGRCRPG